MQLSTLAKQFLNHLQTERGRSEKTVENYGRSLAIFFKFVKVRTPAEVTEKHVRSFSRSIDNRVLKDGRPLSVRTRNYHRTAVRIFLKYLETRGIRSLSPSRVMLTRVLPTPLRAISTAQWEQLRVAPDIKTLTGKRDRAIIECLGSMGMRVSEVCGLLRSDIDFARGTCRVRGGQGWERVVPIQLPTARILRRYMCARTDTHPFLFIRYGRKQNVGSSPRLSSRAVERLVAQYAAQSGVTTSVTPQMLRHYCTVTLIERGMDVRVLGQRLGHMHGASTKRYERVEGYDNDTKSKNHR